MEPYLQQKSFSEIDSDNSFFDSLKNDYEEFNQWFEKKARQQESAYVLETPENIEGFLYLKQESDSITDVTPNLNAKKRIKIGTMKINPHGTKLGERFIKKALDYAVYYQAEELYVTVFSKHGTLVELFNKYGFIKKATKQTDNGEELVLIKNLSEIFDDTLLDYPLINKNKGNKFLLGIYPDFHTRLYPDSILNNETSDIIEDVSHTNSIHKVYVCFMAGVTEVKKNDLLVIYRTNDHKGPAYYRAVATSICTVEKILTKADFMNEDDFVEKCKKYSVFTEKELRYSYNKDNVFVIKMVYNAALNKRLNRKALLEEVGLNKNDYFGILKLSEQQFDNIVHMGGVNEGIIIN
ncbi:hypothetical protein [Salsuginibacillus kocurii]|uniref:hypothetical protein n=1 Tax=Salsuginibacillus kocurii TaxID=427078 RepID=UPI00035E3E7C|nr:hypothetical protein [Salsuginibacillus kocurii]